jgi:predicted DNA-binding transcriptional regulator AlpA
VGSIPFELRSLDAEEAGALLGYSPRHVCERLAALPDFPRRVDVGGRPRWIAGELLEWREQAQRRRRRSA